MLCACPLPLSPAQARFSLRCFPHPLLAVAFLHRSPSLSPLAPALPGLTSFSLRQVWPPFHIIRLGLTTGLRVALRGSNKQLLRTSHRVSSPPQRPSPRDLLERSRCRSPAARLSLAVSAPL
eukprot:2217732-Rhodomonas_salina.2